MEVDMKNNYRIKAFLKSKEFTLVLLTVIVVILFTVITGGIFLKPLNIRNILNSMVIVSFLTIGEGMLIIYGNIDLSGGAVGTLCAVILGCGLTNLGLPWYLSLSLAFAIGIGFGFVSATLIVKLNIQPFIATLAMASVAEGLTYVFGKASAVDVKDPVITFIGTHRFADGLIPFSVIISLALLLVYGLIMSKTEFGRIVYMCGCNREAARLAGLKPKKICYILFANMGFLSALSGVILAARMKSATVTGISGSQFAGITAAILGGVSFGGGSGGILGAFIGLLLLNCFNNGMTVMGVDPYWQTVASGALLIIALLFDFVSMLRKEKNLKL
jgi:ribose/xylose/arabinose/galactoside ABC-type transport system permease subunit